MPLRSLSDLEICRSLLTSTFLLAELCKSMSICCFGLNSRGLSSLLLIPYLHQAGLHNQALFFLRPCLPQADACFQISHLCKDSNPYASWGIKQGWDSALPWYNSQCHLYCLMYLFQRMQLRAIIKYHVKTIFQDKKGLYFCCCFVKTTNFSAQRATQYSEDRSNLS